MRRASLFSRSIRSGFVASRAWPTIKPWSWPPTLHGGAESMSEPGLADGADAEQRQQARRTKLRVGVGDRRCAADHGIRMAGISALGVAFSSGTATQ